MHVFFVFICPSHSSNLHFSSLFSLLPLHLISTQSHLIPHLHLSHPPPPPLQFAEWLEEEHKLELDEWNFVYGYSTVVDADGKKSTVPATARVYPASKPLDYSLIPALDLTPGEATKALMKSGARPQQQYVGWADRGTGPG